MKKFNKSITIEVEIDHIAEKLLNNFSDTSNHKELIVESIIGSMISSNNQSLNILYNALNGYTNEIDFVINEPVKVDLKVYGFWTTKSKEDNESVMGRVTNAIIKDINLYTQDKLLVEYDIPRKDGSNMKQQKWINHRDCIKLNEINNS
jgi:hypothetical protein